MGYTFLSVPMGTCGCPIPLASHETSNAKAFFSREPLQATKSCLEGWLQIES